MKLTHVLVVSVLFFALPWISKADDTGAVPGDEVTAAVQVEARTTDSAEAAFPPALEVGCGEALSFSPMAAWKEEAGLAPQSCGSCSSSGCRGAIRGQQCYLGSGQGWGNCNIYSGGYRCSTGGWECQCGSGPLP